MILTFIFTRNWVDTWFEDSDSNLATDTFNLSGTGYGVLALPMFYIYIYIYIKLIILILILIEVKSKKISQITFKFLYHNNKSK